MTVLRTVVSYGTVQFAQSRLTFNVEGSCIVRPPNSMQIAATDVTQARQKVVQRFAKN
jgi:hypothetical protein